MLTPGGRGSIPALVMRTGLIQPVRPQNARRDLSYEHIQHETVDVTNPPMGPAPMVTPLPALPSAATAAVAATVVATPPRPLPNAPAGEPPLDPAARHRWHIAHRRVHPVVAEIQRLHPRANINGAEPELGEFGGLPEAKFEIAASVPSAVAGQQYAASLRNASRMLVQAGLGALPAQLVGGPLAALMAGGVVQLHFQNGVVVRATP